MHYTALASQPVRTTSWPGRGLSGLVALFLIFDGVLHIARPKPVVDAFAQLGYPLHTSVPLGLIALAFVALYLVPRTATVGALLLTAYLGGATAAQVRIEAGWFPTVFPALIGVLLWAGLALRDSRVLAVIAPNRG